MKNVKKPYNYVVKQPKRDRTITPGQFRALLTSACTPDEVRGMMRSLPPKDFLNLYCQVFIPKQNQVDMTNTLRLIIEGFQPPKEIQATVVQQLEAHEDDDGSVE